MKGWSTTTGIDAGRPMLTVDPGLHTGIALAGPDGSVFAAEGDWDETLVFARDSLVRLSDMDTLVVCESFTITAQTVRNSAAPWSLEGIGVLRFLCRRHGAELVMQAPVEAKRFATNPRLKAQGWYIGTPGGHVNDALRHLYLAAVKQRRLVPPAGVV